MRVVVASDNAKATAWLEPVLRSGGFSVVVVTEATLESPELHGADVLIVDSKTADALADAARPIRRLLLAPRGGTLELEHIRRGFSDIIVVPSDESEVVARVRHAVSWT
jgi:DNA-binding response OmpR family regulator